MNDRADIAIKWSLENRCQQYNLFPKKHRCKLPGYGYDETNKKDPVYCKEHIPKHIKDELRLRNLEATVLVLKQDVKTLQQEVHVLRDANNALASNLNKRIVELSERWTKFLPSSVRRFWYGY